MSICPAILAYRGPLLLPTRAWACPSVSLGSTGRLPDSGIRLEFPDLLENHGIHPQWTVTKGAHEWPLRRGYLRNFASLLFQQGA